MKHNFKLDFSPNLIVLLGEQLIHDKKIAISELVKNAYDADADKVTVNVSNDTIVIEDDGWGMDLDIIQNHWLKPGSSSKKNINTGELTPKHNRMPIGEKGVGRLGSHKLGNVIELVTKKNKGKEIHLKINWLDIEKAGSLNDLEAIVVSEKETPEFFNGQDGKSTHGTKITITGLKENWEERDYIKLARELTNLISPFEGDKSNFSILFSKDGELFDNDLSSEVNSIKETSLFEFKVLIRNGQLKDFYYQFKPWTGLEKVKGRQIDIAKDKNFIAKTQGKTIGYLSLDGEIEAFSDVKIGDIEFQGFIYDYDNKLWDIQTQMAKTKKTDIKKYIKSSGGVRVYRDNFRVFNYGEEGNDILNLDLDRVNRPAGKISSNQILAAIELNRSDSTDLVEKTNREGFINNPALQLLKGTLGEVLDIISLYKQDDKAKIIKAYLENAKDRAGIEKKIHDIQSLIDKSDIAEDKKNTINNELDKFAKEFDETKNVLLNAASTGLNLAIVVHELGKLTHRLEFQTQHAEWNKVKETAELLQRTIHNYGNIIRLDKKHTLVPVADFIETALANAQVRFEYHKVEVSKNIEDDLDISVKKNLVSGLITNLFDNALYWLDYQGVVDKKIHIQAYKKEGQVHVMIADNGLGFTIDFESAIMPFMTGRRDESSTGIGLYLADQVMIAHEGFLMQGDCEEEKLSTEFKDGAIIKLIFKG